MAGLPPAKVGESRWDLPSRFCLQQGEPSWQLLKFLHLVCLSQEPNKDRTFRLVYGPRVNSGFLCFILSFSSLACRHHFSCKFSHGLNSANCIPGLSLKTLLCLLRFL